MKLYASRGFEWAEEGLVGLWCPVLTGGTQGMLLDCNPSTNNHGTLTGYTNINTAWVGREFGTCLGFSEAGIQRAETATTTPWTILAANGDFVLSAWVRIFGSQSNYAPIATTWSNASNGFLNRWCFSAITNRFTWFDASGNVGCQENGTTPLNQWLCYTIARNGSTVSMYRNGELQSSTTSANQFSVASPLSIGGVSQGADLNGVIGEFWFARPLSLFANTVATIHQAGLGGMWQLKPRRSRAYFSAAGFKAYWHRRQSQLIGGGV